MMDKTPFQGEKPLTKAACIRLAHLHAKNAEHSLSDAGVKSAALSVAYALMSFTCSDDNQNQDGFSPR